MGGDGEGWIRTRTHRSVLLRWPSTPTNSTTPISGHGDLRLSLLLKAVVVDAVVDAVLSLPNVRRRATNSWAAIRDTFFSTKEVFESRRIVFTVGTSIASVLTAWADQRVSGSQGHQGPDGEGAHQDGVIILGCLQVSLPLPPVSTR